LTIQTTSVNILLSDANPHRYLNQTLKENQMAKAKSTTSNEFVSITDIGLKHGRIENDADQCAMLALQHIHGFPVLKDVSEENMAKLKDGYALAFKEVFKPKTYAVINGHYVIASPEHISNDKVEKIELTLDYCTSFTTHEIGTAFKDNPALKTLIQKARYDLSTYISNKVLRLVARANDLLRKQSGETTKRDKVLFEQSVTKFFDAQIKSVKVKEKGGDPSANPAKFLSAIDAFWKAYRA
jgi:hypothetical protein